MLSSTFKKINFAVSFIFCTLVFALLFSNFLSSCAFFKTQEPKDATVTAEERVLTHIVGVAMVEPVHRTLSLHPKTAGIVKAIYHDIDSKVKKDEIILQLDDQLQQKALAQIKSKLSTQKSFIAESEKQIALLKVRLDNITKNYERDEALIVKNIISQQAFDNSQAAYLEAKQNWQLAKQSLITQKNRLEELQKEVSYQEEVLEQTRLRAPLEGKILSLDIKLGESVTMNQAVGELAPEGPWMAITEIDEIFADKVQEGMRAYLRPQGKLDTLAVGKVLVASPALRKKSLFLDSSSNMEDRRVREVRVLLQEHSELLIGEKVECVIILDSTPKPH